MSEETSVANGTPGPWTRTTDAAQVEWRGLNAPAIVITHSRGLRTRVVAVVPTGDIPKDVDRADADASLIIAGPDLLDAANYLASVAESAGFDSTLPDDEAVELWLTAKGIRDILAAIAKATGGAT